MNTIPHSRPDLREAEVQAAADAVRSGWIKGGPRRNELERVIAEDQGFVAGVATSSCTQAAAMALRVLFPQGRARVAVSSLICRSMYDAIQNAGCTPMVVDADPLHLGPMLEQVKATSADALICAHLAGIKAPVEAYAPHVPWVIEDCAQRIELGDRPASSNILRIFSFEATKVITSGEGGLLLLPSLEFAERARHLRSADHTNPAPSFWAGFSDLQAAVARVQWARFPEMLERRKQIAGRYLRALPRVLVHPAMHRADTTFFRFLLRVKDAPAAVEASRQTSVAFRRPVAPMGLHQLFQVPGDFPQTEEILQTVLSLPIYSSLTDDQIVRVIETTMNLPEISS